MKGPYLYVSYGQTNALVREPYQKVLIGLAIVALILVPFFAGPYVIYLLNLSFLAVISAVGLNLLTGYCGQVSLGHASFMGIGAFATAILDNVYSAPFWLAIPAACAAGGVFGFLVGLPSLRFRGIYLAITTLAMHYAIVFVLTTYQANVGASATAGIIVDPPSLWGFSLSDGKQWYIPLLVFSMLVALFGLNLSRSYVGRAWIAIRDRDIAAAAMGIDVPRFKLIAFVVSAVLAALAGSLGAYFTGVVTVETYTLELAILALAMIIVGGLGSIVGSIFGALFITLLPFVIDYGFSALPRAWRPGTTSYGLQEAAIGITIILFLLFEPKGLVEIYRRIAEYFERWPFRYREIQGGGR
ncbi:branched-chain amino acid ABC transporter permease [Mesorhizobium sp.]|uniref:branched-chain amino acid ABC transporter permease n=1 Tax=Mesorhizobium sp. TaxID=1871066 RepID=UPI0025F5C972|nr:branched-chain amino acid ABC transporter permease [Mesorhizobium sp.]